jgi:hypothetical protein
MKQPLENINFRIYNVTKSEALTSYNVVTSTLNFSAISTSMFNSDSQCPQSSRVRYENRSDKR